MTENKTTVVEEIAAERRRQIESEGWTVEHDDTHKNGEMACAAACYALPDELGDLVMPIWPAASWSWDWWKPKDRRRDLIRAAALIVAEIERLDRSQKESTP